MMMDEIEVEWDVAPVPLHADPLLVFYQSLLTKARSERELRMTSTPRLRRILKELGISGLKEVRESDEDEDEEDEEDEECAEEEPAKGRERRSAASRATPPPVLKRQKKRSVVAVKEETEDSSCHSQRGPAPTKGQAQFKMEACSIMVQPSNIQGVMKVETTVPAAAPVVKNRRKNAPTRAAE
jgi:hypothetical protein